MRKMFGLLLIGYKCQIFDKGNIWKVNDEILNMALVDKKDLAS